MTCQGGQAFVENDKVHDFASLICSEKVESTEWSENQLCGNGGKTVVVGYKTTSFGNLKLYEACVMSSIKRTLYVKHNLKRVKEIQKVLKYGKKEEAKFNFRGK